MNRREFTARMAGALAMAGFGARTQDASAQDAYPQRPIRVVVPFPPAGGSDIIARQVGERMARRLGQPMVIENKPGAAGNIGLAYAAKQAPDGYTIALISTATVILNPLLYQNLTYDAQKDFTAIGLISRLPYVLCVNPNVPARTLAELIALAKAKPGSLTFASPGNGHTAHVGGELLKERGGFDMVHVPYQGAGPATNDLLGGQITMMFELVSDSLQLIQSGRLRAIAIATPARSPLLPEVPTLIESGMADFELTGWFALAGITGTPPQLIQRLNAELNQALTDPTMRQWLAASGQEPLGGTPADLDALMSSERRRWAPVVKKAGIVLS